MKSHELVEKINNGEIKDGTEFSIQKNGSKSATNIIFDGKERVLRYSFRKSLLVNSSTLLHNDLEFEIVEEHKGWFKPKMGEQYAVIDEEGDIYYNLWGSNKTDWHLFSNQNCFRDEAEAQEYLDYKSTLKEAEKPFQPGEYNFYMFLNRDTWDNGGVELDYEKYGEIQGATYLGQDEAVAQAFIDKWKHQILKYEFGIFE